MIGDKIKRLRKQLKISGPAFADLIAINKSTLSRYEHNTVCPSIKVCKNIIKLAGEYDVDIDLDYLLKGV